MGMGFHARVQAVLVRHLDLEHPQVEVDANETAAKIY